MSEESTIRGDCDRRGLLKRLGQAAGIGAAAAVAAPLLADEPADAADGQAVILGNANDSTSTTTIGGHLTPGSGPVLDIHDSTLIGTWGTTPEALHVGSESGRGIGVSAPYEALVAWVGQGGIAIVGTGADASRSAGVGGSTRHAAGFGVWGWDESGDVAAPGRGTGVKGDAVAGVGVWGQATDPSGIGVRADGPGDAVRGVTTSTTHAAGVAGIATANGGFGVGGYGQGGADSIGVYGTNTAGTGPGVKGTSVSGAGVVGVVTDAAGVGVRGVGPGDAVQGKTSSTSGYAGVSGIATANGGFGVGGYGQGGAASIGVFGTNTAGTGTGVKGTSASGTGVHGAATSGYGVRGAATTGHAVHASATLAGGVGVYASAGTAGTALQVSGVARFSRSGSAVVPAGSSHVTVSNVALTTGSLVLATIQQAAPGTAVSSAVPNLFSSSFVLTLTKAVSVNTKIAWFVVN